MAENCYSTKKPVEVESTRANTPPPKKKCIEAEHIVYSVCILGSKFTENIG